MTGTCTTSDTVSVNSEHQYTYTHMYCNQLHKRQKARRGSTSYCIAENFRGRKLSRISWFCGYSRKFSPWNLGRGIHWRGTSEQSAKISPQKSYFSPIRESFLPQKFPAIYMVHVGLQNKESVL